MSRKLASRSWERSCLERSSRLTTDKETENSYLKHRDPRHTVHYTRVAAGRFEGLCRLSPSVFALKATKLGVVGSSDRRERKSTKSYPRRSKTWGSVPKNAHWLRVIRPPLRSVFSATIPHAASGPRRVIAITRFLTAGPPSSKDDLVASRVLKKPLGEGIRTKAKSGPRISESPGSVTKL